MSQPIGVRSFHQSPHHFCSRCGREFLLTELQWQEGNLRCPDDIDTMLIREREAIIAQTFTLPVKELQPDPKLVENTAAQITDTINFII